MKVLFSLIFMSVVLISSIALAGHSSEKFSISCSLELIGGPNSSSIKDEASSEVLAAHSQALVRFDLGDYVLRAISVAKISRGQSFDAAIPTLDVTLLKKGAGVASNVNYVTTPVVANVGESRSVSSFNFLKLDYKGQTYSRIDYTCAMTRVE